MVEALTRRDEIAARLGMKLHAMYSMAPEHGEVAVVKADPAIQIAGLVMQLLPS